MPVIPVVRTLTHYLRLYISTVSPVGRPTLAVTDSACPQLSSSPRMSEKPELGYWAIRGLAQPIRLLLAYTGTKFVDTKYKVTGTAPNFDKSAWFSIKFSLGLDFPNLPYFKDDQVTSKSPHCSGEADRD